VKDSEIIKILKNTSKELQCTFLDCLGVLLTAGTWFKTIEFERNLRFLTENLRKKLSNFILKFENMKLKNRDLWVVCFGPFVYIRSPVSTSRNN
jgi:hypothetical protein